MHQYYVLSGPNDAKKDATFDRHTPPG